MNRVRRLETLARAGYFARAVVYGLLGYFALTTAKAEGTTGVMQQIREAPAGDILLILVGIGLAGYGVFRLYGAWLDLQGHGSGFKGIAVRIGHAASGLAHLFLAYFALKTALWGAGAGGEQSAGTVAQMPGGDALLLVIGLGFLAAALNQATKAITANFMGLLEADAPRQAKHVGRAGYAARAVVFLLLGWQLIKAIGGDGASQITGIGSVLDLLRDTGWIYTVVAIGLLLFGVFSLVMARYRRICNDDVIARLHGSAY